MSVISEAEKIVKERLDGEESGHDWWHTDRVRKVALLLAEDEDVDTFVLELAALLHDVDDYKFSEREQETSVSEILNGLNVPRKIMDDVVATISDTHFRGAGDKTPPSTMEGKILQDADRLDAIGAIGVARAFATGAKLGNPMHDPDVKPRFHANMEEYRGAKGTGTTITHIREKILHLKDRMNTDAAKTIAEDRHKYFESFLKRFLEEWEGKR